MREDLEQGNKREARSDHHHQSAATTTTTTRGCSARGEKAVGKEREREKKIETAQEREIERESSTARVFGLREFSAELHFRFVMRQKKGAAALFIGKGKGNPKFLSNEP
ncbi:hypothetical protein F2Q68_00045956 [Brassica cretica]|uniref:Uncharacterized protein n=1 Tax=Brassica cretica TaxID=69181 RepID=A0A8S9LPH6_BRACR|nr:hypothetical protein F2Q68_00045956 [Brassica cretica]